MNLERKLPYPWGVYKNLIVPPAIKINTIFINEVKNDSYFGDVLYTDLLGGNGGVVNWKATPTERRTLQRTYGLRTTYVYEEFDISCSDPDLNEGFRELIHSAILAYNSEE